MLDGCASPVICETNPCSCKKWFVHLKTLTNHPHLNEDEIILWLWLATKIANNPTFSCSYSYEQISQAMNMSEKIVHRCLFRLKLMGLLNSDIPIWYGTPTREMASKMNVIKVLWPPASFARHHELQFVGLK